MKAKYPNTYEYFKHFEVELKNRSGYIKYLRSQPFYAQYNIGPYSFAKYKVAWLRISNDITAAVATDIVPDNGVTFVPFDVEEEAHYFCALMNSTPIRWAIAKFSVAGTGTWGSPQVLTRIAIPRFDPKDGQHSELSDLSILCHTAASNSDLASVAQIETKIDEISASLWGISKNELSAVYKALHQLRVTKLSKRNEDMADE